MPLTKQRGSTSIRKPLHVTKKIRCLTLTYFSPVSFCGLKKVKGKELLGLKGKLINKCVYLNKKTQVEITSQKILTRVNTINKLKTFFSIVLQIMHFNVIFFLILNKLKSNFSKNKMFSGVCLSMFKRKLNLILGSTNFGLQICRFFRPVYYQA